MIVQSLLKIIVLFVFNFVSAFRLLLCVLCCDIGVCLMTGQALYSHWESCINITSVVLKLDAFYLLVSDYFKTSHEVYSTTLRSTWHVWRFKVLSYLRNLAHLVFQELPCLMGKVTSIFPPTANLLWNIKVFPSVWIESHVKKNTLHSFAIRQTPYVKFIFKGWARTGRPCSSLRKYWCHGVGKAGYGLIHTCGLKNEKWTHIPSLTSV